MNKITKYILIGLGVVAGLFLLWYFLSIVVYILISAVLALIGGPLVTLICNIRIRKWKPSRAMGAAFALLTLWVLISTFFSIFIPALASEANELAKIDVNMLINNFNEPIQKFQDYFNKGDKQFSLTEYAAEKVVALMNVKQITEYAKGFASMLGDIFIAIFSISFITFFFLKEERMFGNSIILLVPTQYIEEVTHIIESSNKLLKRYFIGIGIQLFSVGFLVFIGMLIVGLKFSHALIIGTFAGIVNVIPYIGPIIGTSFGLIFGVVTHLGMPFYPDLLELVAMMSVVYGIVHVIDNILFQPLIFSNSVKAHPLEIFLVILIAGTVGGIIGMVIAIPAYTILRVVAKEFFNNSRLVKKLTSKMGD